MVFLRTSTLLFAIAICTISSLGVAAADKANTEKQARAYFRVGEFDAAAHEFLRAHKEDPKPSLLFNAALSFEKAGLLREAAAQYTAHLQRESSGDKAIEARARKLAIDRQLLAERDSAPPLAPTTAPPTSLPPPSTPPSNSEGLAGAKVASSTQTSDNKERRLAYRTGTVILGSISVSALAAAAILTLQARGTRNEARDPSVGGCNEDLACTSPRGIALLEEAQSQARKASIGFGIGVLAAGVGTYLWISAPEQSETSVGLRPHVSLDQFGLALEARY